MTDEWMQERSQAPLDRIKGWVATCTRDIGEVVKDRIGIAQAGKRMLDQGGEAAELGVLAKKLSLDAVALDNEILSRIEDVISLYSEAASLLRNQTAGLGALGYLAESYAERAQRYAHLCDSLGQSPEEPPMSDVEWDAVRF